MERLYHFLAANYALEDIRKRRLKIARLDDLNDPFELKCVVTRNPAERDALNATVKGMAPRFGVLCFTECCTDILQWSHYADRHRGMCLAFDVATDERFMSVGYVRHKLPLPKLGVDDEADRTFMKRVLSTKFEPWSYEREKRVFTQLSDPIVDPATGQTLFFKDFESDLVLREVILGQKCETKKGEIFGALAEYAQLPKVLRAGLSDTEFKLEFLEIVP